MTERVYSFDSHLLEFQGTLIRCVENDGRTALVLDRSAFYPTGGGQPHDTGRIESADGASVRIVDVTSSGDDVLHWISPQAVFPAEPGATVTGHVDADRRRDHLQQHSGQHILSQAFVTECGAETMSFHLGEATATIDVKGTLGEEDLVRAERLANEVIFSDRTVTVHSVGREELDRFKIRKQTFDGESIRLIDIEDFDVSTCGGTHASRTGEIGALAILGSERVKNMTRVEFVCGSRTVRALRSAQEITRSVSRLLTTSAKQVPSRVSRLLEEHKAQGKRVKELFRIAADVEAAELLESAEEIGTTSVVTRVFKNRPFDEVRTLAHATVRNGKRIALFGLREGTAGKLLFARSDDVEPAMGDLMRASLECVGGRGGGNPGLAQGAVTDADMLEQVLAAALGSLREN